MTSLPASSDNVIIQYSDAVAAIPVAPTDTSCSTIYFQRNSHTFAEEILSRCNSLELDAERRNSVDEIYFKGEEQCGKDINTADARQRRHAFRQASNRIFNKILLSVTSVFTSLFRPKADTSNIDIYDFENQQQTYKLTVADRARDFLRLLGKLRFDLMKIFRTTKVKVF